MSTIALTKEQKANVLKLYQSFREERRQVRESLYQYVKKTVLTRPNYVDGKHIKTICDTVNLFLDDPTKQILVISTPPRHMKSTIISEALPCWYLSNNPQKEVIVAAYNQSQARKMARACRQSFDTEAHRHYFKRYTFSVDTADEFMITGKRNGRPSLIAAGVGSGLTGSGADLVIMDDTIKDMAEASSSVIRENVIQWYESVVVSRLSPGGKTILVQTRWHYEDLPGVIIEQSDPSTIIKLNLPAIDDDGKALWPERYDLQQLNIIKSRLSSRVWEALYQGRPTAAEGGIFKRNWFNIVQTPFPREARRVRYWDMAATHDGGDYTVGCLMAEYEGRYCIEDIQRGQLSAAEVQSLVKKTAEEDRSMYGHVDILIEQEPGSSGVETIDLFSRFILKGFSVRPDKVTGSKELRADPLAAALECRNVDIVSASWNRELISEFCEFGASSHDDIVDSCSGAYRHLKDYEGYEPKIYFF